ncbi:hypothetical protein J6590_003863 [Homalodisca vitripennis]|nr:hypothetical protein J6590_003863 [Homalodisca vitripennis]
MVTSDSYGTLGLLSSRPGQDNAISRLWSPVLEQDRVTGRRAACKNRIAQRSPIQAAATLHHQENKAQSDLSIPASGQSDGWCQLKIDLNKIPGDKMAAGHVVSASKVAAISEVDQIVEEWSGPEATDGLRVGLDLTGSLTYLEHLAGGVN